MGFSRWSPYRTPPLSARGSGRRGTRRAPRGGDPDPGRFIPFNFPRSGRGSATKQKPALAVPTGSERSRKRLRLEKVRMGAFGNTRVKLRPRYKKLGRDKEWKHRSMNEDPTIYRMIKANQLDDGHGYNVLKFSHVTPGELPLWVCDLTTFHHVVKEVGSEPEGNSFTPKPWWKLNLTKSVAHTPGTTDDSVSFESINYTYDVEYAKQPVDGTIPTVYKNQILKWIDFRGMFYGTNNRDVDWDIRVVRIGNPNLHVVPEMDLSGSPPTTQEAKDALAERRLFWAEMCREFTANPIVPGAKVDFRKSMKTVWKTRLHIPAKENTVAALNSKQMKVFLRLNRLLNYDWRHTSTSLTNEQAYDFMNTPNTVDTTDRSSEAYVKPGARLYLLIRATCPVDSATADRTYADGFTMINTNNDTVGLTNTYAADGTIAQTAGYTTNDGVPTTVPALAGELAHGNTGTFIGSNIFAFKKGPVGAVITTGEAIGVDNPTFDFVLRAKLIQASR